MAGILDPKTRVMDFILTELGREQAAQGELNVKYATFTDRAAFYSSGSISGVADDASERIYFEAASSPHDMIVVESDFEGKMKFFRAGDLEVEGGKVINPTSNPGESSTLQGSKVIQQSVEILNSITASFRSAQIIKTTDMFMEGRDFTVSPKSLFYSYNDDPNLPPTENSKGELNIETMPSLFQDRRLSYLPNFKFLPPRNAPSPENNDGNPMGEFIEFKDNEPKTKNAFRVYNDLLASDFEKRKIYFNERTPDNNIIVQPFEFVDDEMSKLSIIDGGQYVKASTAERRHVFYVGKLYADSKKTTTYAHIFTLVFREINR